MLVSSQNLKSLYLQKHDSKIDMRSSILVNHEDLSEGIVPGMWPKTRVSLGEAMHHLGCETLKKNESKQDLLL